MVRRKYTREFKLSAPKLVNEQAHSPVEAAKSLGVDPHGLPSPHSHGDGAFPRRRPCHHFEIALSFSSRSARPKPSARTTCFSSVSISHGRAWTPDALS